VYGLFMLLMLAVGMMMLTYSSQNLNKLAQHYFMYIRALRTMSRLSNIAKPSSCVSFELLFETVLYT